MHHHAVEYDQGTNDFYEWETSLENPFEELLICWNIKRPDRGSYSIYVSVDTGEWSPWLLYAEWGSEFQKGFKSQFENVPVRVYQDAVEVTGDNKGYGFKIKVIAKNGANLSELKSIHVCSSNPSQLINKEAYYARNSSFLDVKGLSQMALSDSRNDRLCSPTSTTAVIRFLNNSVLDPIQFAESSWDMGFDIFGNWVFNVAEAYNRLASSNYYCWVERYSDFSKVIDSLDRGMPTVISVKGPLKGSAQPYKSGHLIAVIGFDEKTQEVICMDPAFPSDRETIVRYQLNDLLKSWGRRKNVAYVFYKVPEKTMF